jgi:hypothetical protein
VRQLTGPTVFFLRGTDNLRRRSQQRDMPSLKKLATVSQFKHNRKSTGIFIGTNALQKLQNLNMPLLLIIAFLMVGIDALPTSSWSSYVQPSHFCFQL